MGPIRAKKSEYLDQYRSVSFDMVARSMFYYVKLPFILVLIIIGLVLEFLIELPFMIALYIDRYFRSDK